MDLSIRSKPFRKHVFEEVVRVACRLPERAALPEQVAYLMSYLQHEEMGATSMLVEYPYVDRHYLTEYQGYYATALRDTPRHTTRVHLFTEEVDVDQLGEELTEASADARRAIQERLQHSYLGFVILRPLPAAPVGRTVLRWFRGSHERCFGPPPPPHRVHIFGLRLKAHGVQFHQQDRAVGACATAALWCSLASVMRRDGRRSPTPLAITETASRSLPTSRTLPAVGGLTLDQMVGAINAAGYSPDVVKPTENHAAFKLQLTTYLRSGIPVVLQVREEQAADGHAVTAVGFRAETSAEPIAHGISNSWTLRAAGMTRLYVHDDRIGPYARMVWHDDGVGGASLPILRLWPHGRSRGATECNLRVWSAIAPLYPKIRINALDLHNVAAEVWPMAAQVADGERDSLILESFFTRAGDYLSACHDLALDDPARRVALVSTLLLSRYVGVLRFATARGWVLDVICDATDIHRAEPRWASVIAIIPAKSEQRDELKRFVAHDMPHISVI